MLRAAWGLCVGTVWGALLHVYDYVGHYHTCVRLDDAADVRLRGSHHPVCILVHVRVCDTPFLRRFRDNVRRHEVCEKKDFLRKFSRK